MGETRCRTQGKTHQQSDTGGFFSLPLRAGMAATRFTGGVLLTELVTGKGHIDKEKARCGQ
jgi:hypothetical protein